MKPFQQFVRSRVAIFAVSIFLIVIVYQTARVVYKTYETETQISALQSKINANVKKREQLLELQKLLQNDFFAEREARVKLGMKKANEHIVVITSQDKNYTRDASPIKNKIKQVGSSNTKTIINNPRSWWDYFFSNWSPLSESN